MKDLYHRYLIPFLWKKHINWNIKIVRNEIFIFKIKKFFCFLGIKMLIWFVWSHGPWFKRGSDYVYGIEAGVFTFCNTYGSSAYGFRVVLIIL